MSRVFEAWQRMISRSRNIGTALLAVAILTATGSRVANGIASTATVSVLPKAAPGVGFETPVVLGDLNEDGEIDLLDLLRERDLINAFGPPPTGVESVRGDLDGDGLITDTDVTLLREVLQLQRGAPVLLDQLGEPIAGKNVTVFPAAAALPAPAVVRIEPYSAQSIKDSTGVDFAQLIGDSTYLMTAFDILATNGTKVVMDSFSVTLDSLPPCNLEGQNLLLYGGITQTGQPGLFYGGDLEVQSAPAQQSVMLSRAAQSSAIGLVTFLYAPRPLGVTPLKTTGIPGDGVLVQVDNAPKLSTGLVCELTVGGTVILLHPIKASFSMAARETVIIPIPIADAGTMKLRFRRKGTAEGWTAPIFGNVQPLPALPSELDPRTVIASTFDSIDSLCVELSAFLPPPNDAMRGLIEDFQAATVNFREKSAEFRNYLLNQASQTIVESMAAAIHENSLDSKISAGLVVLRRHGSVALAASDEPNIPTFDPDLASGLGATGAAVGLGAGLGVAAACPLCAAIAGAVASWLGFPALYNEAAGYADDNHNGWEPDPPLSNPRFGEPYRRPVPSMCINVWRHNTNGWIRGGYEYGSGGGPFVRVTTKAARALGGTSDTLDYTIPPHPLKGCLVLNREGGLPYVVGILNDDGVAAFPGIRPGATARFALYDPISGRTTENAGIATSPPIVERGVYFPVFMRFDTTGTNLQLPLAFGFERTDSLRAATEVLSYRTYVGQTDLGRMVAFGVRSSEEVSIRVTTPGGTTIYFNDLVACLPELRHSVQETGVYEIRIAAGLGAGKARLTVGASYVPNPPTHFLCGNIGTDSLLAQQYSVDDGAFVPPGMTLRVARGSELSFGPGGSLTASGTLAGTFSNSEPFRLNTALFSSSSAWVGRRLSSVAETVKRLPLR